MISAPERERFPFRKVLLGAFLPSLMFSVGLGALLPIIAPFAVERGATLAGAAMISAMLPVGKILADLPAGAFAAKVGDQAAMLVAAALAVLACVLPWVFPSAAALTVAVLVVGAANSVFNLARHSYLTEITPKRQRARVLSALAGMHHVGQFVGPFLGAGVIFLSDMSMVYWLAAGMFLVAIVTIWIVQPPRLHRRRRAEQPAAPRDTTPFWTIVAQHGGKLVTMGLVAALVGIVRGSRTQIIPLWGEHIGLDASTISIIFGISSGLNMLFFYPSGKVMDAFGRLWVGVPAMTLLGLALALVPATSNTVQLAVVAAMLGIANGWGAGTMMTIGSDISPEQGRPQFLSAWRLLTDLGMCAGPLVLSAAAAIGSLALGAWIVAAMGPLSAAGMQAWLPRYSVDANRRTRRRARGDGDQS